ncbi:MAG TPA: Lrp/AsnC family transcriptional regulator [Fimbriimonadaceae bacterium]|nr:Lrp/AsnC family transcriptional regulator [Fimbriimonadaceae bacterium]HRJ97794.1 Lrp/AsnC family transcriptional regulator [Fimbriimonadaceae bacterium]
MRDRLDEVDLHILRLLQKDGRITNADLAREVKLSPPSVLQRVRKLEELRIIRGYSTMLDQERLGFSITVFAQISLALHQEAPIERFRRAVLDIPEILECYHVSGEFDFLLKIVVEDMKAYEALVRNKLSHIKGLGKIQTCFVLATTKMSRELPLDRIDPLLQ